MGILLKIKQIKKHIHNTFTYYTFILIIYQPESVKPKTQKMPPTR